MICQPLSKKTMKSLPLEETEMMSNCVFFIERIVIFVVINLSIYMVGCSSSNLHPAARYIEPVLEPTAELDFSRTRGVVIGPVDYGCANVRAIRDDQLDKPVKVLAERPIYLGIFDKDIVFGGYKTCEVGGVVQLREGGRYFLQKNIVEEGMCSTTLFEIHNSGIRRPVELRKRERCAHRVITDMGANLMSEPGHNGDTIADLEAGTIVDSHPIPIEKLNLWDDSKNWIPVDVRSGKHIGKTGWINGSKIRARRDIWK